MSEEDNKQPLIMLVDDHMPTRLVGRKFLQRDGFHVEEVDNGTQAVDLFDKVKPDILLLDVVLPDVDGFTICENIRSVPEYINTPILMMTGLDDHISIGRAYEVGATDFVTKPINWVILSHRIRYMLRACDTMTQLEDSNVLLRKSEARLANAQKIAQLGNWEWNLCSNEMYWSPEMFDLLAVNQGKRSASYTSFLKFIHPDDRESVECALDKAIQEQQGAYIEHRIIDSNGQERVVEQQTAVYQQDDGEHVILTGTIQDVTEKKRSEEKMRYMAYYDNLTGLPNRRLFKERSATVIKQSLRYNRMMALFFLDLDHFKRINDTLGHTMGDNLLKACAKRLRQVVRDADVIASPKDQDSETMVARFGGDEFTLLISDIAQATDAAKVARRILKSFAQPLKLAGRDIYISTSIGISVFPADGDDVETILRNADVAMYHAKDSGRNNYQFYSQSMNAKAFERLALENNLRKALEKQELVPYYQPKFSLHNNKLTGFEVLLRWCHPDIGLVAPSEFISIAEETGLIIPIGEWILMASCQQLKYWHDIGFSDLTLAVNISSHQFKNENLVNCLRNVIAATNISPDKLELEITESVIMDNCEETVLKLEELKQIGVSLAIDDFGTGYSSLSYLKRFPIDHLKIDKSFIHDITIDPDDAAISKAVIVLSHSLNLTVTAEGVESVEQLEFLAEHNCDEVQGFLFSKPVNANKITQELKNKNLLDLSEIINRN